MIMSYEDEVKKILNGLTDREKKALRDRFGIDLSKPHTMKELGEQFQVTRRRIREIERKALRKLSPDGKYLEPKGPECSFCGRAENETKGMAKHESGFNICKECIELSLEIINSEDEKRTD